MVCGRPFVLVGPIIRPAVAALVVGFARRILALFNAGKKSIFGHSKYRTGAQTCSSLMVGVIFRLSPRPNVRRAPSDRSPRSQPLYPRSPRACLSLQDNLELWNSVYRRSPLLGNLKLPTSSSCCFVRGVGDSRPVPDFSVQARWLPILISALYGLVSTDRQHSLTRSCRACKRIKIN